MFLQQLYPAHSLFKSSPIPLSNFFIEGLQCAWWPGRCQEIPDPRATGATWFLDGAHTVESLMCGMEWFVSTGVGVKPDTFWFVLLLAYCIMH